MERGFQIWLSAIYSGNEIKERVTNCVISV